MQTFNGLEEKIHYNFKNKNLLRLALTHSSYSNENNMSNVACNERIEFLGDAVLEFASSDFIYRNNPEMPEGQMTSLRANLVCEDSLAISARLIKLGDYLLLGKGEKLTGGADRNSILSDAFEALIGAIYLDGGFEESYKFIERFVLSRYEERKFILDSKTKLQEIIQAETGKTVTYKIIDETGPDHDKLFRAAAFIGDEMMETGEGKSKKNAEKDAAYKTIMALEGKRGRNRCI